jgi:hypothetical protein
MRPNGPALSCGADNFHNAPNKTSSLYQLSTKHKTYARHEFRTIPARRLCGGLIPSEVMFKKSINQSIFYNIIKT